jgi:hypothetical protein
VVGVEPNWRCVDLASGPVGILENLARRVGTAGTVVGVEKDADAARAALDHARNAGHANVHLVIADLLEPALGEACFDLVHLRFALHLVEPRAAVCQMRALARPGGWVALEEPDLASWDYHPPLAEWRPLLSALCQAIALRGDPNVGRELPGLIDRAGLEGVETRRTVLTLDHRHPHMRLPLAWAAAQREAILRHRLAAESELDRWIAALEAHVEKPGVAMVTPTTVQAWGRRPN